VEATKIKKPHTHHESDFKKGKLRMLFAAQLNSDKNIEKISKPLRLVEMSSANAWYT